MKDEQEKEEGIGNVSKWDGKMYLGFRIDSATGQSAGTLNHFRIGIYCIYSWVKYFVERKTSGSSALLSILISCIVI